jgi:hypothetical protein
VAQLGSGTTTAAGGPAAAQGGSPTSRELAYAGCMRSHGVPTFPDPAAGGQIPKSEVVGARQADPSRFDSANNACRRFLPNGGAGETPAQIAQDWNEFRSITRCMRSHGVSTWPDPTDRSATDKRPNFRLQGTGIDPGSPQLRATAEKCATQLHLGLPPDASLVPSG